MVDKSMVSVSLLDSGSFALDDELVLSLLLKVLSRVEVLAESTGDTETLLATAGAYLEIYDRLIMSETEGEHDDES